jgi:CheY-like chemotaxis protein
MESAVEGRASNPMDERRVLIVEDNPADERLTRMALSDGRRARCVVESAADLGEVVSLLRSEDPFDVVLLDLNLPDAALVRVHLRRARDLYPARRRDAQLMQVTHVSIHKGTAPAWVPVERLGAGRVHDADRGTLRTA